jgi:hypothetical protein
MTPTGSLATRNGASPSATPSPDRPHGSTTTLANSTSGDSGSGRSTKTMTGPSDGASSSATKEKPKSGRCHTTTFVLRKKDFYGGLHNRFEYEQVATEGSTASRTHNEHHQRIANEFAILFGQDSGCKELSYLQEKSGSLAKELCTEKTTLQISDHSINTTGRLEPIDARTEASLKWTISDTNNPLSLLPVNAARALRDTVIEHAPLSGRGTTRSLIGKAWR